MPTSQFVESGFWNFDTLFVPQQHPARESQDTFYLSDPSTSLPPPKEYYDRVSKVHASGGYGSLGYRAPWSDAESQRLVLRTHTTAVSSYLLRKIATHPDGLKPAKLFSIDRVFRNEATDNTHLAEFHQVEGVVADYNLTLPDLMGQCVVNMPSRITLMRWHRFHEDLLWKNGYHESSFQTRLQPVH